MAHVTFVHGIANKPKADELLAIWRRALGDGGADTLRLGTQGVSSSLVYWADVLYEAPDPDVSAHEGVLENTARAIDGGGDAPLPTPVSPESAAFIDGLRAHLTDFSEGARPRHRHLRQGRPVGAGRRRSADPDDRGAHRWWHDHLAGWG
jgi:hypothetical protein